MKCTLWICLKAQRLGSKRSSPVFQRFPRHFPFSFRSSSEALPELPEPWAVVFSFVASIVVCHITAHQRRRGKMGRQTHASIPKSEFLRNLKFARKDYGEMPQFCTKTQITCVYSNVMRRRLNRFREEGNGRQSMTCVDSKIRIFAVSNFFI